VLDGDEQSRKNEFFKMVQKNKNNRKEVLVYKRISVRKRNW
jgi:hypothetical protein